MLAACILTAGLTAGLLSGLPQKGYADMTENRTEVTSSNARKEPARSVVTGDIWDNWIGDISFLSGSYGDGSKERPYQIATKAQLMGLSELAAMGMKIGVSEGTYPGDYSGSYFELTKDIDLGGMEWIPIGFYKNGSEINRGEPESFEGYFNGNGKTISNFRLYRPSWDHVGLFGRVRNSEIKNLTVKPGYVITAGETAGILAGSVENSVIRDVRTAGALKTLGDTGGIAGEISEGTVIENCTADHIAMDSGEEKETCTGGIAGRASESLIADCIVNTGDSLNARIQGGGYVGGITGFQNDTDIFNVRVMGTIGGTGSQSIGGVTGKYASGKLKVARFEGRIASSGLGNAAREGTFLGTHDTGFHFRYGTEEGADLAYLFADQEGKIRAGICGSGIPEDNRFTYDAHIGFWHSGDNCFTLIQGEGSKEMDDMYFYEELEQGILHLIDTEEAVKWEKFFPDHFAPGPTGRPVKGHLVSVLQIDTAANVENYYDVAVLTVKGVSAYGREINKEHRGAVAPGDLLTVVTAPKNTAEEKYQMEGTPTYTDENGIRRKMAYQTGGSYTFIMPDHDTEISAVYKKVAANIRVIPEEISFRVTEERTGDRRAPSVVTEVKNAAGKLIARYINGKLESGTQVQEVTAEAAVDKNNDVADSRVRWSVDDRDLLILKQNDDEDTEGYTGKRASIELNLQADFFQDIIRKAETEQAEKNYRYPIPDTVYGNGTLGGIAVLTAMTRPASSFEGKPLTANCRIPVTFQIRDKTKVAADGICLDKDTASFTVTRMLTGDRRKPEETVSVSGPVTLNASFGPEYFDKRSVSWSVNDSSILLIDSGSYSGENGGNDYRSASIRAVKDSRWIRDIMETDDAKHEKDPYCRRKGTGEKTAFVTVEAEDMLGNRKSAVCEAIVTFVTMDETEVRPESIEADRENLEFDMILTKTGPALKPEISWSGSGEQKVTARVVPEKTDTREADDIWPELFWEADRTLITVGENGTVSPVTDAEWIKEAMKVYPYSAKKETVLSAKSGEKRKDIPVVLNFRMEDKTYASSGGGSYHSSGGSTGKKYSSGITTEGTTTASVAASERSITGIWVKDGAGRWLFTSNGRTYANEWAYIHNPYASDGQENASWFLFGADGAMMTGWYQDPGDNRWYYLHDREDGSLGHMYTGWNQIDGSWYFFDQSGRMTTGWNWIGGKCYYLDPKSGGMLSGTMTPDGYYVDDSGAWVVDGIVQLREND